MSNFPSQKKKNEYDIYGIVSFVIMIIFISIIILLVMYYSGTFSMETEKNPFKYNETNTIDADVSADDITETTVLETEITDETIPIEMLELIIPSVEIISDKPLDYLEELYPDVILKETTDAGQEYIDNIIFLGDSITNGLRSYRMLKDGRDTKQVWTPVTGTLTLSQANVINIYFPDTETEITIKEAVGLKKPPMMIITLGVNGVSFMGEDYFKSEYIKLVESIKEINPETIIILQSMYPIAKTYQKQGSINNVKITTANEWIAAIAQETGTKYLNTYTALIGEDGYLPEEYHNGDGMHFNEIGFNTALNYIRTHAYVEVE